MKKRVLVFSTVILMIALFSLVVFTSCSNSPGSDGTIELPAGLSTVDLGNGETLDIDTPVPITVKVITDASGYPGGSKVPLVSIEGDLAPGQTVTLTFNSNGSFGSNDSIAFVNSNGEWEIVSCTINGNTVTATVAQLSVWGVIESSELVELQVTPTSASIAEGYTVDFTATGIYNNGTNSDLVSTVTWHSDDEAIATISNDAGTEGRAYGWGVGTTSIYAVSGVIESNHAQLTVTDAVLEDIQVTPTSVSRARGLPAYFTATGIFSSTSSFSGVPVRIPVSPSIDSHSGPSTSTKM